MTPYKNLDWVAVLCLGPIVVVVALSVAYWLRCGIAPIGKIFVNIFRSLAKDDAGQDLVEYALMVPFFLGIFIGILPGAAASVVDIWTKIRNPGVHLVQCYSDGRPFWLTSEPFICGSNGSGGVVWLRIACAAISVMFLAVIVLRRKHDPDRY